jgi:hypothetical protein
MDVVVVSSSFLLLRLALVFLVAGGFVSVVLLVTERRGGVFGGLIGGLPSTSAFFFLFAAWIESPEVAVQATTTFPLFMSFTGAFLLFYAYFARRGFVVGLLTAFGLWFLLSFTVVVSGFVDFDFALAGCVAVSIVTYYVFARKLKIRSPRPVSKKFTWQQRLMRFIISGGLVVLAVLASDIGGAIFGAVFAAFPAMFTSILLSINNSQGTESSRGMTMSLMVSAMLMVVPYAVAVRYLYPSLGFVYGTIAAYTVSAVIGFVYYRYGKSRLLYSPSLILE